MHLYFSSEIFHEMPQMASDLQGTSGKYPESGRVIHLGQWGPTKLISRIIPQAFRWQWKTRLSWINYKRKISSWGRAYLVYPSLLSKKSRIIESCLLWMIDQKMILICLISMSLRVIVLSIILCNHHWALDSRIVNMWEKGHHICAACYDLSDCKLP